MRRRAPPSGHLGGCSSHRGTFVPVVWDKMIEFYNIKSVIDVGCGYGHSLKYFLEKGLDGIGIEGWDWAINESLVKDHVVKHDYTLGEYIPDKDFDLGWCCEFVEHVEEKYIGNFIVTLKKCQCVAMTHAFRRQRGYHHVNKQNPPYWLSVFEKEGFTYLEQDSLMFRKMLLNEDGTLPKFGGHIAKSLMIFKRNA